MIVSKPKILCNIVWTLKQVIALAEGWLRRCRRRLRISRVQLQKFDFFFHEYWTLQLFWFLVHNVLLLLDAIASPSTYPCQWVGSDFWCGRSPSRPCLGTSRTSPWRTRCTGCCVQWLPVSAWCMPLSTNPCTETRRRRRVPKNWNMTLRKWGGRGSKAVWNFSENASVLRFGSSGLPLIVRKFWLNVSSPSWQQQFRVFPVSGFFIAICWEQNIQKLSWNVNRLQRSWCPLWTLCFCLCALK